MYKKEETVVKTSQQSTPLQQTQQQAPSRDSSAYGAAQADRQAAANRAPVTRFTPTRAQGVTPTPASSQTRYQKEDQVSRNTNYQEVRKTGSVLGTTAQQEQAEHDSWLAAAINGAAAGDKNYRQQLEQTEYSKAVDDLLKLYSKGEQVKAEVNDGKVSFVSDYGDARIFYSLDENGNKTRGQNDSLNEKNLAEMQNWIVDIENYLSEGNINDDDSARIARGLKRYSNTFRDGLVDDIDISLTDGTKLKVSEYMNQLLDNVNGATDWQHRVGVMNDFANFMSDAGASGNYTLQDINDRTSEAQNRLSTATDQNEIQFWNDTIGQLDAYWGLANRKEKDAVTARLADVTTAKDNYIQQRKNLTRGFGAYTDMTAYNAEWKRLTDAQKESEAQEAALNAQLSQLDSDYMAKYMTPEVQAAMDRLSIARLGKAYPDAHGKADAERMRQEDQALVDEWNRGIGLNPQYYNWQDRVAGVTKSWGNRTLGSVMNLAAWGTNAVTHENEETRTARLERDAASRDFLNNPTAENQAKLDEAEAKLAAAENAIATGEAERTTPAVKLEQIADSLGENSQEELAKAKQGLGKLGQFGIDLASTALDVGFDSLTGGGLKTMFARVLGSGIGEARQAGATSGQQLAYGLSQAAIEVMTEKLSDGLGFAYGKGVSTDVTEKVIQRLSTSDAGANLLRLLSGAIGEGGEEVISDLLDPFTKWIIDESARDNRVWDVDLEEVLYDFLLGGAMGLLGQGVEAVNGGYAEKNADIAKADEAITDRALNAEATGEQLSNRELKDLSAAQAREESRQQKKADLESRIREAETGVRQSTRGRNRMDKTAGTIDEGMQATGYANDINLDEAYAGATPGVEDRLPSAEGAAGKGPGFETTEAPADTTLTPEELAAQQQAEQEREAELAQQGLQTEEQSYAEAKERNAPAENTELGPVGEETEGIEERREREQEEDRISSITNENRATGPETALGAQEESTQQTTPESTQKSVKPSEESTQQAEGQTASVEASKAKIDSGETNNKTVAEVVKDTDPYISAQEPVTEVNGNKFAATPEDARPLSARVGEWFKQLGGRFRSNVLKSNVVVSERGVKNDIAHGIGDAKAATFEAIPKVLENGQLVSTSDGSRKGKSYTIAAKVMLDGKPVNVYCVVKQADDGSRNFYLHEVTDGQGTLYYQMGQKENAPSALQDSTQPKPGSADEASVDSIAQQQANGNNNSSTDEETGGTEEQLPVQEEQTEEADQPHTPGTRKTSQSSLESDIATKGEKVNTDANTQPGVNDGTFTSRTNADRSHTADLLTDSPEKSEAQYTRLMEAESWTDDDVVIAQKLLNDMLKNIRDYQLGRKSKRKMTKDAFATMTKQYNDMMNKHIAALSEAGQKLQANYEFSVADKIIQRAAHTFLGFSKDGRFVGTAQPSARNARIYSGIENAADRIQKAVDAGDAQAVAQVCKDISTIRNVKKMFGPLAGFTNKMESNILGKIAKQKDGVKALETLAYGNLNAICDDVQPYKALNAAKTIRVMNMLSNIATIVNNLVNNFAQGAMANSAISNIMTNVASKPFEKLNGGKPVVSKFQSGRNVFTKEGRQAGKEIINAELEALQVATLMQMYGVTAENGRLELNDRGMFNPNVNPLEAALSTYKFLIGMGVEATDQLKAAGLMKSMELGLDKDVKAGKLTEADKALRMEEARHEVNKLLYKDENAFANWVQGTRNALNKWSIGNERIGTIGAGDITMAFAKIPANVIKYRLSMTPEGALYNVFSYAKGVAKAKKMHAEVLANNIAQTEMSDMEKWVAAREQCSGSVFKNLMEIRRNYGENMTFDQAVERAGYQEAKEMSLFEMAQNARRIGRAATSVSMVALGSALRALGAIKDFDEEPDDELRKMYSEKGYKGLMLNFSAMSRKNHEWKDGDLILDGEWLEVIALPLTIGATAAECAATAQDAKTWNYIKSIGGNGLAKTFEAIGDIPGMSDAINFYDSLNTAYGQNPDDLWETATSALLNYGANTIPSFFMPNAATQATAGLDNTMRDIYTTDNKWQQAANIFKSKFPGLRNTLPASVDVWGNERTYGENRLWGAVNKMILPGDVFVYHQSKYEKEIERLVRAGYGKSTPKTTVSGLFEVGDEKYTLTADEKIEYKQNRNDAQRIAFETFMDSKWYDELNDDEREKVFQSLKTSCDRDAKQTLLNDRGLDVAITRDKWETELGDLNDQIQFLSAKQLAGNVWDRDDKTVSDYKDMDEYLTDTYSKLSDEQRSILTSTYTHLDDLYDAKKHKINSKMWQTAYDIFSDYTSEEGKNRVEGSYKGWEATQMWTDIAKATGADEEQMKWFEDNMKLYNFVAADSEKYHTWVDDFGWSRDAAQNATKALADLKPAEGKKTVSYKQRLTSIAKASGTSAKQRWDAVIDACPSSYTSILSKLKKHRDAGDAPEKALKDMGKWME